MTGVLLGAASMFPVPTPAPVALAAFTADAPTEWWWTEVPRRPVAKPELAAAPTQPAATVTRPTSAPVKHAHVERKAPAPAASTTGAVSCRASWLSGVKRVAQVVGCDLSNRFDVTDIGGYRAGSREHGSGKALDLMVGSNRAKGDAIAAYLLANREALGVQHVIWRQRINYGQGWKGMENRGSATANHLDHLHLLLR